MTIIGENHRNERGEITVASTTEDLGRSHAKIAYYRIRVNTKGSNTRYLSFTLVDKKHIKAEVDRINRLIPYINN